MENSDNGYAADPYQLPPQNVTDIIDADPSPGVQLSPDANWMLLVERNAMPGIKDVARRMLRLAGLRIDPAANGPFYTSFSKGLLLRPREGGEPIRIPLEDGARLASTSWSHNSKSFAYTIVTDKGTQLWAASIDQPNKPRLLTEELSTVTGGFQWLPDGETILCRVLVKDRGPEPKPPAAPIGPTIQESSGNRSPTRTYQDLLASQYDEQLFEYYATARLAMINIKGSQRIVSEPGIFVGVSVSPNGQHMLLTKIGKPFSYLLTYRSFPKSIEVRDMSGQRQYQIANVPLEENIPIEGVRTGPRRVEWKSVSPATLVWQEALDGGDPNKDADFRDKFMTLAAPFSAEPKELMRVEHRGYGLTYFRDSNVVTSMEYDRDRRWIRSLLHHLDKPDAKPTVIEDRSIRDRYGDPGRLLTEPDETGHAVVRQDGDFVYRAGAGASPDGNLPFLDRQNLASLKTERLWRCEKGTYERVVGVIESSAGSSPRVITVSETPTLPPNFFDRDLARDSVSRLTDFPDPTPEIRGITKKIVKYKRADGVPLSATLYLPANYKEGTRLPLIVWAYPREFSDAKTAAQISGSPSQFTRISSISHLTLLTQGYAIMNNATMPVIGDPETMNDTFIEQIVGAAQAAIDKAVELGVADPKRVGVGGHSYGAFMTANLLAHSDLFQGGVARSGAYNRTLTPFGFQSERRSFWEARNIYYNISPFMHADKIKTPLLLIHGENDNNSGTFPLQSKRMYQAVKGNGGTVRLVMLPYESHGYRARESILHTQAEMIDWFDKYVKNATQTTTSGTNATGGE